MIRSDSVTGLAKKMEFKRLLKLTLIPFTSGALLEYVLVNHTTFYVHMRLHESKARLAERQQTDDAVDRLMQKYPEEFKNLKERWERLKRYEDGEFELNNKV